MRNRNALWALLLLAFGLAACKPQQPEATDDQQDTQEESQTSEDEW